PARGDDAAAAAGAGRTAQGALPGPGRGRADRPGRTRVREGAARPVGHLRRRPPRCGAGFEDRQKVHGGGRGRRGDRSDGPRRVAVDHAAPRTVRQATSRGPATRADEGRRRRHRSGWNRPRGRSQSARSRPIAMTVERLLQDTLLAAAAEAPSKEAVVTGRERTSYAALLDQSLRIARVLQDHGLERGDRVALLMDNSVACAASIFGALLGGGVFVVVNPQTKRDKLEYIL